MTRQTSCFLLPEDEFIFSHQLRELRPLVQFIDDDVWPTDTPPVRPSIRDCQSKWIYFWDPDIIPTLSPSARPDRSYQGPSSHSVIRMERCVIHDDMLLSSTIDWACEGDAVCGLMQEFFADIKKALIKAAPDKAIVIDPRTKEIINAKPSPSMFVGPGATKWVQQEPYRLFRDRSVQLYLFPRSLI